MIKQKVFELLSTPRTFDEICDQLNAHYFYVAHALVALRKEGKVIQHKNQFSTNECEALKMQIQMGVENGLKHLRKVKSGNIWTIPGRIVANHDMRSHISRIGRKIHASEHEHNVVIVEDVFRMERYIRDSINGLVVSVWAQRNLGRNEGGLPVTKKIFDYVVPSEVFNKVQQRIKIREPSDTGFIRDVCDIILEGGKFVR